MQLHDYPGTCGELLPTLLQPADFDKAQASIDGRTSTASAGPEDGPAQCCMDAMANLNAQCVVFKRSADALGTPLVLFAYVAGTSDKYDELGFYVHTDLYAASVLCHSRRTSR